MTTTQQPKHPAHRMSSGKDILSRMLQMEKQIKQQRASSTSPNTPSLPNLAYVSATKPSVSPSPARSPRSPPTIPQSPLRPSPITRSHTAPVLTSADEPPHPPKNPQLTERPMPLSLTTDIAPEEKASEICLSPSWSDHGEKARKKEKRRAGKEQKEREKKLRQDEERQKAADVKAGKRLSKKPPPAAMETQKMPTSLRRNSWISFMSTQSSSGENTRRSSREEKRSSGMSFGSIKSKRSQSTPGTSTESPAAAGASEPSQPIVGLSAPKLPSFRWSSSRRTPSDHIKSASSEGDDSYDKDLIAFAYRLEASEIMAEPEELNTSKQHQNDTAETAKKPPAGIPMLSHSATEPTFKTVPYDSVSGSSPQRSPQGKNIGSESKIAKGHDRSHSGQPSPGLLANGNNPTPSGVASSPTRPSYDGSSYVHKQRMYQQQRSIAGFEDQQAVQEATEAACELAAKYEASLERGPKSVLQASERGRASASSLNYQPAQPPTSIQAHSKDASVSPVYTKQRDRSISPDKSIPVKHQPTDHTPLSHEVIKASDAPPESQHVSRPNGEDSVILSKPQVSAGSKTDRILGFRRRTKQPPSLVTVPYNAENQVVAVQSAPVDGLGHEEPAVKRSRIQQLFKEPRPAFANKEGRSSSSSSQSCVKEVSPETKPTQSHSRTRTASSTVLNDNTACPLPGSTTDSTLNKAKKDDKNGANTKHDHNDQEHPKAASRSSPKKSHVKESSPVPESKPKSKPTPGAKGPKKGLAATECPRADGSEAKAGKKQAHEIIVESETGEGLIRKTSIKRPRSNPQLQTQTTATNSVPVLDFLPPLKHQPLVKRERHSPTRTTPSESSPISISQFKEPIAALAYESPNPPDLKLIPRSPLRPPSQFPVPAANRFNRSSTEVGSVAFGKGTLADGVDAKPVAKLFVICCKCKFWHDLPSKLYEAMALPLELHKVDKGKVAGARLETAVKCPWCEHAMTTGCCQGWTTVVYMHERHH